MKLRRKVISTIVILGLIVGLLGLTDSHAKKKHKYKYVWKAATLGQKSIPYVREFLEKFQIILDNATNKELTWDIYWGGSMGDEEDYLAKMRIGQLDGAMITGSASVTESLCPALAIMSLPFLFDPDDPGEIKYIIKKIRGDIIKSGEKSGYKILTVMDIGFDQFYSTKYKLNTIEEFQKAKILTWFGATEDKVLRAIGSSPIPVNVPEVVTSMRSGVCNAAISPALWWVASQLYTVTKYVNPLPLRVLAGVFVVTMKAWNTLPSQYGKNIMKEVPGMEKFIAKGIDKITKASYSSMLKYGLEEVKTPPEVIKELKRRTRPIWDELAGDLFPRELLDEVLDHLKKYRAMKAKNKRANL